MPITLEPPKNSHTPGFQTSTSHSLKRASTDRQACLLLSISDGKIDWDAMAPEDCKRVKELFQNEDFLSEFGVSPALKAAATPFPTFQDCVTKFDELNDFQVDHWIAILAKLDLLSHPKFFELKRGGLNLLNAFYVQGDIDRLEQWGIGKDAMAVGVMMTNIAPALDAFSSAFGKKRTRKRDRNTLLSAIPVLTKIDRVISPIVEQGGGDLFPNPHFVTEALRSYAWMLDWSDWVTGIVGVNSLLELAKYAVVGMVKRVTGKYHDREVSAIIGAALDAPNYDETTHRAWRIRNYRRLDAAAPCAALAFEAANTILLRK